MLRRLALVLPALVFALAGPAAAQTGATAAERDSVGLWEYESLGREGGTFAQLRGYFVFLNGWFVQQSLNVGEPFEQQVAQAHAGPTRAEGDKFHLTAIVGAVVSPGREPSASVRRDGQHVVTVKRMGDRMDLVFGSGTIQKFRKVGPGQGKVYPLERGALALVDGRFILVSEAGEVVTAGSGKYTQQGNTLTLDAERWFSSTGGKATYARGPMTASFDGRTLTLPAGTVLKVAAP